MRNLIFLSFFLMAGCGIQNQLIPPQLPMPPVVFASQKDINDGKVKRYSYLVAFKLDSSSLSLVHGSYADEYYQFYPLVADSHIDDPRIKDINHISAVDLRVMKADGDEAPFTPPSLKLSLAEKESTPILSSISEVTFNDLASATEILTQWEKDGVIWFADPNYTSALSGFWDSYRCAFDETINPSDRAKDCPNSTNPSGGSMPAGYQLHKVINTIGAFAELDKESPTNPDKPIIAVMDSGIDTTHPQIQGNMWTNTDALGEAGCGNNDVNGCNTTTTKKGSLGDGDIYPAMTTGPGQECPQSGGTCDSNCCHGTHVAGIIAAPQNKEYAGVCPICQIMAVKIIGKASIGAEGEKLTILDSWIAAGLKYVAAFRKGSPVRIINASFGKFERSRAVGALVATLVDTPKGRGTIIIGAAGNEDSIKMQYPAGFTDAIAVANLDQSSEGLDKAPSSNFGPWVDIAAPGTKITSAVPGGSTLPKTGTSMAAPVVSGVAGLLIARDPNISVRALRGAIINSADPSIYSSSNINKYYLVKVPDQAAAIPLLGSGMLNAEGAIAGATSPGQPAALVPDRVKSGCGVVADTNKLSSLLLLMLSMCYPAGTLLLRKKKFE